MSDLSEIFLFREQGLKPDLDMTVDKWSDKFMVIPKSSGSNEYGPYRTERTPHAREIMLCLSDDNSCTEVVAKIASQMFKTQIGLNWFSSAVHQSPSNFLWLMPTGKLQKRIASRIDKVVKEVDVLRERVAKPNSRDAMNNQDIKEYVGGSLLIATAGSAANLSEVPIRRVIIDEIDRCESDVEGEGDPKKLADNRQTTFEYNKKSYYPSSPTIEGESRIDELFNQGTQRHALAECIHCGHFQELIFENLILSENDEAIYPCAECGGIHKESDKELMFKQGRWSEGVEGNGKVESFTASALFLPYGWMSWRGLMAEYEQANSFLEAGDESKMIVFFNTRLARCWERKVAVGSYEVLKSRALNYKLRTAPEGVLFLTAGVDTQDNRLAVQIVGWGRGLKVWVLDYIELPGDPAGEKVWESLTELLNTKIKHESGSELSVIATGIDIGGHRSTAAKNYVYSKKINTPVAVIGSTSINTEPLKRGRMVNVNRKDQLDKRGVILHSVGTIEIKHHLFSQIVLDGDRDPESRIFNSSSELDDFYFRGVVESEKYNKKTKRYEHVPSIRNEPLDTLVYAYAVLYHKDIRAYDYKESKWLELEEAVKLNKSYTPGKISLENWKRG